MEQVLNGTGRQTRPDAGYSISGIEPTHDVIVVLEFVPVSVML